MTDTLYVLYQCYFHGREEWQMVMGIFVNEQDAVKGQLILEELAGEKIDNYYWHIVPMGIS